jgi:hypothetical protein
MAKGKWTKEWPMKPGRYWFYGWPYGHTKETINGSPVEPELNYVNVWKISNGIMWVREGQFWNKGEGAVGLFCKADVPEFPDVSGMIPKEKKK